MMMAAAAIATVESQPTTFSRRGSVNAPVTPLMAAVENSALIGSIWTKLIPIPSTVPPTIVA